MPAASAIEVARQRILDALLGASLPPWRVHKYPPQNVASPCIWIDFPTLGRAAPWVSAEFPIVIALDGSDQAQASSFDYAVAQIWDALNATEDVAAQTAAPWARDIGGTAARLYVITALADLSADVLCLAPLHTESATTSGGPP